MEEERPVNGTEQFAGLNEDIYDYTVGVRSRPVRARGCGRVLTRTCGLPAFHVVVSVKHLFIAHRKRNRKYL